VNYKKIFINLSLLSLGAAFTAPTIVSASTALQKQEQEGSKQLKDELSKASEEEFKVIKRIRKDKNKQIITFHKLGNGSTDGAILVYAQKKNHEKTKKEIGDNPDQIIAGTPVKEYFYKNQNVLVIEVECRATTDEESRIQNFGAYEEAVIANGEPTT